MKATRIIVLVFALLLGLGNAVAQEDCNKAQKAPQKNEVAAMRSVPDSHLINDYQPLDHRLISFTISTYSAAWSEPVRQLISTSQPLDHFLLCWSFSSWSST